jgi:hypothetical protein
MEARKGIFSEIAIFLGEYGPFARQPPYFSRGDLNVNEAADPI